MSDETDHPGSESVPVSEVAAEEAVREERMATRLAHHWAQILDDRRTAVATPPPAMVPTSTRVRRAVSTPVPWGVDLAAAWSWRFLVIVGAAGVLFLGISYLSVVVLPLVIALLLSALVIPLVDWLARGIPRGVAALLVVIVGLGVVGTLLTLAGQQVATGATDLADQTAAGLGEIKAWLKDGPLNASDGQISSYLERAQESLSSQSDSGNLVGQVTEVGTAVSHVFAGFFIVLFSLYFFLSDGERIWAWTVRLTPRNARPRVDSSGRVAWISLTQFVRATVVVAAVDAIGISLGAAILGVPFVFAIGVLVFIGAFIPLVGATVAGTVAVLVALVDQGVITALVMLAIIIGVQQLEAHVLQPFLLGRWVSVHPLAVIVAIATGVLVAGVAGALVAVPIAAALNAVVQHLAADTDPGDDPVEELAEDYAENEAAGRAAGGGGTP